MANGLRVAYILQRFPHLRQTYILREMDWMRRFGVDLRIYSLLRPERDPVHEQVAALMPLVRYVPLLSWGILRAQVAALARAPWAYLRALVRVARQTWREPGVLVRALAVFPAAVYLAGEMAAEEVQHVHAHFAWLEAIAAGVVRDLEGIPFTTCPHAFDLYSRDPRDVRVQLEGAPHIVTISRANREYIRGLSPRLRHRRIDIVHCGVDLGMFPFRPREAAPGEPLRIVSVGALVEKKGYAHLIDACAALVERGTDVVCDIVGSGPLREELEERVRGRALEGRVRLLGAMSQEDVARLYAAADLFALPCVVARDGDRDGIPVVLMEAMASGVPVVSTDVSGIPELVRSGETGVCVPPGDAVALADALEGLIRSPERRRSMAEAARRTIVEGYQSRENAARLLGIFHEVVDGQGAPGLAAAYPEGRSVS